MTDTETLISTLRMMIADENNARFSGAPKLSVDSPKVEIYLFQNQPRIAWHSAVPNHFCAFINSFDDNHCAAYVYVWEEEALLKCTLRLSNIDGAHHLELPSIPKSLDDYRIAGRVVAAVLDGTERMKAKGTLSDNLYTASEMCALR